MEKRRARRTIKRLEVNFSSDDLSHTGITSNLSEYGIFIRTKKSFPPGTKIELKMYISPEETITLMGMVKWALKSDLPNLKNGMGIDIINPPSKYTEFLKSLK